MRNAKLIDDYNDWIGGSDILVQTGDIVDRGTNAGGIYQLMRKLRGQAASVGGQVVSVLGNHEIMNAIGDWRYAQFNGLREVRTADTQVCNKRRHQDIWDDSRPSKGPLCRWLAGSGVASQVSLSPVIEARPC